MVTEKDKNNKIDTGANIIRGGEAKKLIIFGISDFAERMHWHFTNDAKREVVCFCADKDHITDSNYLGLPVVPFEEVQKIYSPEEHELLLGVGYTKMNDIRKRVFFQAKDKGYTIAGFIHYSAIVEAEKIGEGNIILEQCLIGPFSVIGDCNIFLNNVKISHDTSIGSFNTLAGSTVLCGYVTLGDNCYTGAQSMIFERVRIADYTLIGAGANVRKDTDTYSVIVPARSIVLEGKKSTDFI